MLSLVTVCLLSGLLAIVPSNGNRNNGSSEMAYPAETPHNTPTSSGENSCLSSDTPVVGTGCMFDD